MALDSAWAEKRVKWCVKRAALADAATARLASKAAEPSPWLSRLTASSLS